MSGINHPGAVLQSHVYNSFASPQHNIKGSLLINCDFSLMCIRELDGLECWKPWRI